MAFDLKGMAGEGSWKKRLTPAWKPTKFAPPGVPQAASDQANKMGSGMLGGGGGGGGGQPSQQNMARMQLVMAMLRRR